jgi:tetratricopeptide (TPR) repeat protein
MRVGTALVAGALASAVALASAGPAAAQQIVLTPDQLFTLANTARDAGDVETAEAGYRALAGNPDVEIRTEARFRLGMMLAAAGRHRDAAVAFRAALDERSDAARIRLELARVLALMGDERAAARALRQAQAAGLPRDVALVVDQFANALRATQPFGGSVSFAVVPDSNINRATDAETLDTIIAPLTLSEDARARSGIGFKVGGQAYARLPVGEDLNLVPRLSAQGEFYAQSRFNDISASVAVGAEMRVGRERLQPTLAQTVRYYGGNLYASTQSASLGWIHALGRRAQLSGDAGVARADYRTNDLQDGWLFDLSATYERAFDPGSGVGITLAGSRQQARDPGYSTAAGGFSLIYWREVGRATVFASGSVRRLEADERLLLFPERRREWFYGGGLGATLRHLTINGFAPIIRFAYERNRSSVGIYDFSRVSTSFGITRAF